MDFELICWVVVGIIGIGLTLKVPAPSTVSKYTRDRINGLKY